MNKKDFISIAFLILLICLFFSRLFWPHPSIFITPEFGTSDIQDIFLPINDFLSKSLKTFSVPLWNKNIATGYPIFSVGIIGTFYLPNLILFSFLPSWLAFNISFILIFIIAGIGTYFLAKHLKFSSLIAFFLALIFTFSGYLITKINHFSILQTGSLLPWLVLLYSLFLEKQQLKYYLLFILLLSQQIFAGFVQTSVLTVIFIALYVLLQKKRKFWELILSMFYLSVALVTAVILTAIQILPTLEFIKLSVRAGGLSLTETLYFSYPVKHFITFLNPFLLGNPSNGSYPYFKIFDGSIFWENTGYIGIIPLIMAFLSLVNFKKQKIIRIIWLILILSLFLMLGKYSPAYFLYSFPPLSYFRVPSRFLLLTVFSLTILSGYGIKIIFDFFCNKRIRKFGTVIVLLLIIFYLFDVFKLWYNYHPVYEVNQWLTPPQTAQFLEKLKTEERIYTVDHELVWFNYFNSNGWKEKEPYYYFRNDLSPNQNLLWNIPQFDVYVGSLWTKRTEFFKALLKPRIDLEKNTLVFDEQSQKILNLNAIRYIISSLDIPNNQNFEQVYKTDVIPSDLKPFYIYKNTSFLPRARLVFAYNTVDTVEGMQNKLTSSDFDPKREVVLEKKVDFSTKCQINLPDCPTDQIEWIKNEDREIVLKADSPQNSILVLADSYYPGWKAYIDGKETEILAANLNQRAILLKKGQHLVKFIYKPQSFIIGTFISIISHLFIIYLLAAPFSSSIFDRFRKTYLPFLHL